MAVHRYKTDGALQEELARAVKDAIDGVYIRRGMSAVNVDQSADVLLALAGMLFGSSSTTDIFDVEHVVEIAADRVRTGFLLQIKNRAQ